MTSARRADRRLNPGFLPGKARSGVLGAMALGESWPVHRPPVDSPASAGHEDFQGSRLAWVGEYLVGQFHLVQVEMMGDEPVCVQLVALE